MKENIVKNNSPKDVGIWIRVSTEDQAKGESPAHHLERAKAYAVSRGWTIKEVYDLAGISGKSVKDHPEAKRMLADAKSGHINGLIFSKLARLARNTKELLEFSDYFRDHNADLISISETIDTSTPAGRLFFTIIAAMATWDREEIADRQKASILIRAKLGKTINGMAPFGYQWKDRKLAIQPDEAPTVRKVFELFLEYKRKGTVAKLLNAAGHRARKGALWSDTQIRRVLGESAIKGIYYFNRIRKNGQWKGTEKPEEEWGKVECEPIVSAKMWDQVNLITEEQLKKWKKPGKVALHIFGNMTWCQCGGKMYARSDSPKYHCRKCNHKIPTADLEAIFREELHAFFGTREKIAAHMKEAKRNIAGKETELAALQRQIQKVRDDMKQTHQLYLDGHVTPQGFGQFYKPAEERLNQLCVELPKLEADVAYLKVNDVSGEEVLSEAKTLYERWPKLASENKRKIAEAIIEKIVIGDGEIDLTFSYLPTSEELCKSQQRLAPATG
jgi:site-specific DNA recombinase